MKGIVVNDVEGSSRLQLQEVTRRVGRDELPREGLAEGGAAGARGPRSVLNWQETGCRTRRQEVTGDRRRQEAGGDRRQEATGGRGRQEAGGHGTGVRARMTTG